MASSDIGMRRCPRCHWDTHEFEALCRICGWDRWNGGHVHTWWYSWVDISGWRGRHGQ